MKKEKLSEAMSGIDEALISEALNKPKKKMLNYGIISVAAMLAIAVAIGSVAYINRNTMTNTVGNSVFSEFGSNANVAGEMKDSAANGSSEDGVALYARGAEECADDAIPSAGIDSYIDSETASEVVYGIVASSSVSAGTLTAGFTDDNENYEPYMLNYRNTWAEISSARPFTSRDRIVVTAEGCNNIPVAVLDRDGNALAFGRTNAGGVAYVFVSDGDAAVKAVAKFTDGSERNADIKNGEALINSEGIEGGYSDELDLMLMVDTTGSMGDELEYLKAELKDMVTRISEKYSEMNIRVSVNFYRDHGDDYTVRYFPFTDSIDESVGYINEQTYDGGGDFPEAVDEALVNVTEHSWRENSVKVCFFVLDAPAHTESEKQGVNANIEKALTECEKDGIRIIPVVCSGADEDLEMTMRASAVRTGGRYIYLTDDSGVGSEHKAPDNTESGIYALNELMIETVSYYVDGVQNLVEKLQRTDDLTVGDFSFDEILENTANMSSRLVKRKDFVNTEAYDITSVYDYVTLALAELDGGCSVIGIDCDEGASMYRVKFESETEGNVYVYMTSDGITELIVFGD